MADPILWDRLAKMDQEEVSSRTKARLIDSNVYELDVLNSAYKINANTKSIVKIESGLEDDSDEHCSVAIVMYLLEGKNIPPVGDWVSPLELPGGAQFFRGPHSVPVYRIINKYGTNEKAFETRCQQLGGKPIKYADLAYSFNVLPNLPVAVLLWLADDEFPARVSMLVDRTAHLHFQLDALLGTLMILEEALLLQ